MKYKKAILSATFLLLGLGVLHAQEVIITAGSKATGMGGTAIYTIGQVVYTTQIGVNGSITQGVQQPFLVVTTVGINEASVNLELSAYPNPTTDYLTLKVEDDSSLSYQLCNLQGKVIESKKLQSTSTNIHLEAQPTATYFLRVIKGSNLIKTFKIIKN